MTTRDTDSDHNIPAPSPVTDAPVEFPGDHALDVPPASVREASMNKEGMVGGGDRETSPVVVAPVRRRRAARVASAVRNDLVDGFARRYPFPLDQFQLEAMQALSADRSVLVAAPTGTGKTVIAEFGVELARSKGMRAIYTAPIKALSNQKFHDWRATYGESVGLLTGDVTENASGDVLVMTTEVLRNMVLRSPEAFGDTAVVIFDEVHFLADPDRGTTWEEAILNCPPHVQLVCLSATVSNAAEIARWIGRVHRETILVEHSTRAVPIDHLYIHDDRIWPLVDATGRLHEPLRVGGETRTPRPMGMGRGARPKELPRPRDVLGILGENQMLPVIYFLFGRRACEVAGASCDRLDLGGDAVTRRRRTERVRQTMEALGPEDRTLAQVRDLTRLLERGMAFHHAGVLPVLKQLVEGLFSEGLLGAVFATETLALGVNMPARSVVIAEHTKYDGVSRRVLLPNEYSQLSGRAGRRGKDERGFAVSLYSPWTTCAEVQELIGADLLPVRSAFTPRYHTVVSLWDGTRTGRERLQRLFASSLRQFQTDDALQEAMAEVEDLRAEADERHYVCPVPDVDDDAIVEYTALRRDGAEARRQVERARIAVAGAARDAGHLPWNPPSPVAVKRAVQGFTGGEVVYLSNWRATVARDSAADDEAAPVSAPHTTTALFPDSSSSGGAWSVFLRRDGSGPGVFVAEGQVIRVRQWSVVTRLSSGRDGVLRVGVPADLADAHPLADARTVLDPMGWARFEASITALGLPDLGRFEADRRARQLELTERLVTPHVSREAMLQERVGGHPCHKCPHRPAHDRAWRREREALRSVTEAEAHAALIETEAATQATRTLDAIVSVLGRFGALTPARTGLAQPTEIAVGLRSLYDPNGLLLLNAARRGWLDALTPTDLMELISWFCYDRDTVRYNRYWLSAVMSEVRNRLDELGAEMVQAEQRVGLTITSGLNRSFHGVLTAWCRGETFGELLDSVGVSEGDLLLTMNKTLDLASQMREALRSLGDVPGSGDVTADGAPGARPGGRVRRGSAVVDVSLAGRLEAGDRLVRRGLVAQSLKMIVNSPGTDASLVDDAPAVIDLSPPRPARGRRRAMIPVRRRDRPPTN
ncbi:MAG: DEAD/DEAH box helicase [Proteobacteria bacterium]|nr:DEAD/DEAH box helicase [Pseudomonadota bacterium]NBT18892.1 DEAD/DEAH box helicase [Pseudomonadota bacterium]